MGSDSDQRSRWREHRVTAVWTLVGGLLFASSAPFWVTWGREHVFPTTFGGTSSNASLAGGCASGWQVVAQNEYTPVGAAVRARPDTDAAKVDTVSPNIPLTVDGWVHATVAYSSNPAPLSTDVWLHRSSGGWVAFAGVRAAPTDFDPTARAEPRFLAALPDGCEGTVG